MGGGQSTETADTAASAGQTAKAGQKDWTVKDNNNKGDTVLIPVDQSKQSQAAFEWYVHHAHRPENKLLVMYSMQLEHPSGAAYPDYSYTPDDMEDTLVSAKTNADTILNAYKQRMDDYGINGDVWTDVGRAGEKVIEAADKFNAHHIVMGTRGFGVVRRTILGSVSEYVLHHSKVPVTVVPKEMQNVFF